MSLIFLASALIQWPYWIWPGVKLQSVQIKFMNNKITYYQIYSVEYKSSRNEMLDSASYSRVYLTQERQTAVVCVNMI